MATALPTIVLVHGAWHTPAAYASFVSALRNRGFTVHCPLLPTCSGETPPIASLPDDVAAVRSTILPLVDAGERVLMVMHSYGGAVGTDAAEGLYLPDRQAKGHPGGVIHLLYLCAYILPPGGSMWGVVEEAGVAHLWSQFVDEADDGSCFPVNAAELFYNGMDKKDVEPLLSLLVRHPLASFRARTTGQGWRRTPATYAETLQDWSVPKIYQDLMLKKAKEDGVTLRTVTYDTNHSIFLTKQKEMVDLAVEAAEDKRNPV